MSTKKHSYSREDLLTCSNGELFGPGNPQLPLPPMLMVDRISRISEEGGAYGRGEIIAELDVDPSQWFFACHFKNDPVMPGCLGLDAMWQLLGFYLGWSGGEGRGRALGVGEVKFTGQVTPDIKQVRYHLSIKRLIRRQLILGIADGALYADDVQIYAASDLRAGVFKPEDANG